MFSLLQHEAHTPHPIRHGSPLYYLDSSFPKFPFLPVLVSPLHFRPPRSPIWVTVITPHHSSCLHCHSPSNPASLFLKAQVPAWHILENVHGFPDPAPNFLESWRFPMTRPLPEFLNHSPSHMWSCTGKGCSPLGGYDCASWLPVLALLFPLLASFPFSPNLSRSCLSHQAQVKACFFQAVLPKPELLPPSQALSQDFLLLSGLDWKHFCIPYQREPPTGLRAMLAGVWL